MKVGPWVGEFGWELFKWQAHIRAKARNSNKKITCITRSGRDILYSDFADVENFDPKTGTPDRWFLYKSSDAKPQTDYTPRELSSGGVFVKYGVPREKFEILIHARNRRHRRCDNWNGWSEMELGDSVASIGSKSDALHIEGTEDMRGISLKELVDYMAGSRMIVGPSSGPMHLATLCGCPQVVWSNRNLGNEGHTQDRYEKIWNPFGTKVAFSRKRTPSPAEVMELMEQI
jgi:hypothetical protein